MTAIKQFFEQHEKPIKIQYPEQFDPKWVVMESGWPCFKLSALDNQPWDKMHIEAESLLEYFKDHRRDYGKGWKSLTNVWPAEFLNRVRFMLLEPGGYIEPHQDRGDKEKRLSVCNISLNNPQGCKFVFKDHGIVPFEDKGSAFLMDISNVHAVFNDSNEPRIHMIIHYELGRRIRDFFYVLRQSYYTNRG